MNTKLNGIELLEFQENACEKIVKCFSEGKKYIQFKSPTGSGKTVILIAAIDEFYYQHIDDNSAFVWFCTGAGDLEEQSMEKMQKLSLVRANKTQDLQTALLNGFDIGSATFINWEAVNNSSKRLALQDGDKKNLYDRIREARNDGRTFYIIIDEAHKNDTLNAKSIIDAFVDGSSTSATLEASATMKFKNDTEKIIVTDAEVIEEGLIAKEIVVNENLSSSNGDPKDDDKKLIDISLQKYSEIKTEYQNIGVEINPLVIVQFPDKGIKNENDERVIAVIEHLRTLGYTTENGTVGIWLSKNKTNIDNIKDFSSKVCFLLIKQAIATGWDCPRSKILVKIRTDMKDDFEIQTIGRIRRMPEQKHYNNDVLDACYIYTYDSNFTTSLFDSEQTAVAKRLVHLKPALKGFHLKKELKTDQAKRADGREILRKMHTVLVSKYKVGKNYKDNQQLLTSCGFVFSNTIDKDMLSGHIKTLEESDIATLTQTSSKISTSSKEAGLQVMKIVEKMAIKLNVDDRTLNTILGRLFGKAKSHNKIIRLNRQEYNGFIIANAEKLEDVCQDIFNEHSRKNSSLRPTTSDFRFLELDRIKYDMEAKNNKVYSKSVYTDYTREFTTPKTRSKCERELEKFFETHDNVEWFYKNGDSGQDYLSILYLPFENSNKERLFFPDYIVKLKSGEVFIIEAKGGENQAGEDQNIDDLIVPKFDAIKRYVRQQQSNTPNLNFGFVRYSGADELLFNNTDNVQDMKASDWVLLEDVF